MNKRITVACRAASVSKPGYYKWLHQDKNKDEPDYLLIKDIFDKGKKRFGWRPIQMRLNNDYGLIMNHKKISHHKSVFKSFRLHLLMLFFICEPILLYKLKKESVILYGSDTRNKIWLRDLNFFDRLRCFSISFLVLLMTPLSIFNPIKYRVWCFKAIKYNNSCIESYIQIALNNSDIGFEDLSLSQTSQELAKKFRYHPSEYKGSLVKLYFQSWLNLFSNSKFIWRNVSVVGSKS